MSWFDRKTHREKYEDAEKKVERIKEVNLDRFNTYLPKENYDSAKRKLEKLYAEGNDEAHKLNKKYDELVAVSEKALNEAISKRNTNEYSSKIKKLKDTYRKLHDFEKKELGIDKDKSVKKNIGTMVGVISAASFVLAALLVTDITGNAIADVVGTKNPIFLIVGFVFGIAWLILRK